MCTDLLGELVKSLLTFNFRERFEWSFYAVRLMSRADFSTLDASQRYDFLYIYGVCMTCMRRLVIIANDEILFNDFLICTTRYAFSFYGARDCVSLSFSQVNDKKKSG